MKINQRISPETVCSALLWCCALLAGYYFMGRIQLQEKFGFHDWYLFIGHAKAFISTGTLYDRNLSLYAPAAAIYKFPPLFASILIFFLKSGYSEETIKHVASIVHIFCYCASILICLFLIQNKNRQLLIPASLTIAFTFEPFFDNYDSSQMEIYILLLLSLSMLFFVKGREFFSGILIGIATAIKIYPLYFASYYLIQKKYSTLSGVVLGLLLATGFSIHLVGASEHEFYVFKILPTLLTEHISGRGENLSLGRLFITLGASLKSAEWVCSILLLLPIVGILYVSSTDKYPKKIPSSLSDSLKASQYVIWLSVLVTVFLLATKNSWFNYQVLLVIPILVILSLSLSESKTKYLPIAITVFACFLLFWYNLGKLEALILFCSWVLEPNQLLTSIMLRINFLRGLATFLILLTLIHALCHQRIAH